MAVASFGTLVEALCELGDIRPPALEPDPAGNEAVELRIDGVTVMLSREPQLGAEHIFVLVAFGPPPRHDELEACRELMELNASLIASRGACFCRHPTTGDLALQLVYPLETASPVELFGRLREMTGFVHQWQRRDFHATAAAPCRDAIQP